MLQQGGGGFFSMRVPGVYRVCKCWWNSARLFDGKSLRPREEMGMLHSSGFPAPSSKDLITSRPHHSHAYKKSTKDLHKLHSLPSITLGTLSPPPLTQYDSSNPTSAQNSLSQRINATSIQDHAHHDDHPRCPHKLHIHTYSTSATLTGRAETGPTASSFT